MSHGIHANFHTHTTRCKHAVGTDREYIETAIAYGYKTLGFSDHVPYGKGLVTINHMAMEEVDEYAESIKKLAREYSSDIRILLGFETEHLPEYWDEQSAMFKRLGVDYLILGQHSVGHPEKTPYTALPTESDEFLIAYTDLVVSALDKADFLCIAHPDILQYVGKNKALHEAQMRRLCEAAKAHGVPLEVNLLGQLEDFKIYPNPEFWKIAGEVGNDTIIGVDAHSPKALTDTAGYEKALALLDRCGCKKPVNNTVI